eukprot:5208795-Pyramimonas_sp.AAC.1
MGRTDAFNAGDGSWRTAYTTLSQLKASASRHKVKRYPSREHSAGAIKTIIWRWRQRQVI